MFNKNELLSWFSDLFNGKTKEKEVEKEVEIEESIENSWEKEEEKIEIEESIKKHVDKIIIPDDVEKIRYFMMELVEKNIWEKPSIKTEDNKINIKIKWEISDNISEIIVDLVSSDKKYQLNKTNYSWKRTIDVWNISISFNDYSDFTVDIKLNWKINDKDLKNIKELFENNFLNKLQTFKNNISSQDVYHILWLNENDKCVVEEKSINISVHTPTKIELSNHNLQNILNVLSLLNRQYYIKFNWNSYLEKWKEIEIIESNIYWKNIKSKYSLKLNFTDEEIILNIESDPKIEVNFLENIIQNLLNNIKSIWNKTESSIEKLKEMWVIVIENSLWEWEDNNETSSLEDLYQSKWFVGYEDLKEVMETNIIFPWINRKQYEKLREEEFKNVKNIVPNAVLFEGPPGTGKTTSANIIWEHMNFPFVYLPINSLMSKWYGESEKKLNNILELAWNIWEENGWVVIMIDEIDEIWWDREKTHEATGRMTGVLLKKLDWLEQLTNILLIASTNRKDFLDPALLSRFTKEIYFRTPKEKEIAWILSYYTWIENINNEILTKLVWKSWRDLKNISEDFVRYYIKKKLEEWELNKKEEFEDFI
jgi:ATP-dependent 26S proteasome regulatory subunit